MSAQFDNSFPGLKNPPRGPLSELETGSYGPDAIPAENSKDGNFSTYSFPKELGSELDHWVCFRVSREHKFRENTQARHNTRCFIYLPMPQNLATSYNAQYQQTDLGAVGAFTSGENAGDFQTSGGGNAIAQTLTQIGVKSAEELTAASIGSLGGKTGALLGTALGNNFLGGAKAGIMGSMGIQLNPHKAMLFQGNDFRSHSFSYQFVPKNVQESKTLLTIVGLFKYFMTPGMKNGGQGFTGAFMNFPEQFDIDFHYGKNLFDIGQSVLTTFGVNYHGQGTPLYHDVDGEKYPASINIDMTFMEVTTLTKRQLAEKNR